MDLNDLKKRVPDDGSVPDKAAVAIILANKRCSNCGVVGEWSTYKTVGRIRYVRCKLCTSCESVCV